jgi:hypothetical protein
MATSKIFEPLPKPSYWLVPHRGRFPGPVAAWGIERVALVPNTTRTKGRSNFLLAVGTQSFFCLDMHALHGFGAIRISSAKFLELSVGGTAIKDRLFIDLLQHDDFPDRRFRV